MTRARELSKLGNPNIIAVDSSNNIGIGSTTPDSKLDLGGEFIVGAGASITTAGEGVFAGVVTATSFSGSGANLTGVGTQGIDIAARGAAIAGIVTAFGLDISTSGVDIDGQTDLDELQVARVSTFSADVDINTTGAVTVGTALTWTDSAGVTTTSGTVHFLDNVYAEFGAGSDLQIYHDASNSYIKDNGTGELKITGSAIAIEGTGETLAKFTDDGAAELYYDNSKKIETIGTGITVTGGVNASGLSTFQGASFTPGSLMKETAYSGFSTGWQAAGDINVSNGNVQYNPHFLDGTSNTLNIVSTVGINTDLQIAESISVTGITSVRETVAFVNALKIDHASVFVNWVGGAAPTAGGSLVLDTYAFTIVKLGNNSYSVIGNQVLTSA